MELKTEGWKKETSRELREVYSCCFKAPGIASQQICIKLKKKRMFQKKEATNDAAFYMIGSSGLDGFPVFELQLKKGRIVGGGFFGEHMPDFYATPTTLNKTNTSQRFKKEIEHYLRTEETGAKYEDFQRLLERPELPREYKSAIEQLCF